MEGVSTNVYKGLKGYWKRRGYEKLNGTGRRKTNRVECAGGSSTKKRFWRIKLTPRVKLKLRFSPKKLLIGLRDAYINFMNRLASSNLMISSGVGGGYGGVYGSGGGYGGGGGGGGRFGARPLKEYDEKMIIEIYKTLVMAQGQIVPRDAAKIGTQVICQR